MEFFASHPVALTLALVSLVVWFIGNYLRKKLFVTIGILACLAAFLFFCFGL